MIRFYLGLWASKFLMLIYKIIGNEKDDKPGMLAYRFTDKVLEKIAKPKLVIVITGTNGKTTTTSLVAQLLKNKGLKVAYNDWGANSLSGYIRCFLGAVNIFNKSTVDACVIEADERTSNTTFKDMNPDYIMITNICRDSIRRNAYHLYIRSIIEEAVNKVPNAKLILNADDPLSSTMKCPNKKYFYSIETDKKAKHYNAEDFGVCPKCYHKTEYIYQHYRHIGKFICPNCGYKSYDSDYTGYDLDYKNSMMKVKYNSKDGEKSIDLPMISDSIFNCFNLLSVFTLGKALGISDEAVVKYLASEKVPVKRENREVIDGVEVCMQMTKGQNISASSVVFNYLSEQTCDLEVVLALNEAFCDKYETETVTWLYETDFEFLNKKNIKKIIVGGNRYLDYKVALLMAGIPEEKIVCVLDEYETANYVDIHDIDKVYVLYEVECFPKGKKITDAIKDRLKNEGGKR